MTHAPSLVITRWCSTTSTATARQLFIRQFVDQVQRETWLQASVQRDGGREVVRRRARDAMGQSLLRFAP